MELDLILIILIVFLIVRAVFTKQREDFSDFYSECHLTELLERVANKYNMKNNDKDWDYYFPCEYNTCEKRVTEFENLEGSKKIFIIDGCDWPASKVHLWKLLRIYYGEDKASTLMPKTYLLDEEEDLKKIKAHFDENTAKRPGHMYILKNYAQRQEGLKIVNKYEDIMDGLKNGFYLVQDYLYNPYLIVNRKINFRYYTLVVCRNGVVEGYIHKDGFVYYTPQDYDENDTTFDKHITTGYIDRKIYDHNPLTLDDFRKHLDKENAGSSAKWDENVNKLMHDIIEGISIKVCKNKKLQKHTLFQLFGSDVAPTKDLGASLMEINKGPDLDAKDERDKAVKLRVQEDIFKIIEQKDIEGNDYTDNRFVKVF